jgi:predicted permease
MKTKIKEHKEFDTVKVFREIKEKIGKETQKMSFKDFKKFLKKNQLSALHPPSL